MDNIMDYGALLQHIFLKYLKRGMFHNVNRTINGLYLPFIHYKIQFLVNWRHNKEI